MRVRAAVPTGGRSSGSSRADSRKDRREAGFGVRSRTVSCDARPSRAQQGSLLRISQAATRVLARLCSLGLWSEFTHSRALDDGWFLLEAATAPGQVAWPGTATCFMAPAVSGLHLLVTWSLYNIITVRHPIAFAMVSSLATRRRYTCSRGQHLRDR